MEAAQDSMSTTLAEAPYGDCVVLSADDLLLARHAEAFKDIDELERQMMKLPAEEFRVEHAFTPGLYTRTIFMPAGTLLTSKIHRTQHPFVVTKGKVLVYTDDEGPVLVEAGHRGITQPGTRRILRVIEDCVWSTFHVTQKTDLAEIEADLIIKHDQHRAGLVQPPAEPALTEGAAS